MNTMCQDSMSNFYPWLHEPDFQTGTKILSLITLPQGCCLLPFDHFLHHENFPALHGALCHDLTQYHYNLGQAHLDSTSPPRWILESHKIWAEPWNQFCCSLRLAHLPSWTMLASLDGLNIWSPLEFAIWPLYRVWKTPAAICWHASHQSRIPHLYLGHWYWDLLHTKTGCQAVAVRLRFHHSSLLGSCALLFFPQESGTWELPFLGSSLPAQYAVVLPFLSQ